MIKVKTIEGIGLACNTFILTDEATGISAVIDAGMSAETFDREADGYDIRYIFLTHGHYDHISCVDYIADSRKAQIIIHEYDEPFLRDTYLNLSEPFGFPPVIINNAAKNISDNDCLMLGETKVKIMHTPGHTMGCVCYIAEDAMFCGDTLFNNSVGRTDFPTSDVNSMVSSLSRLSALQDDFALYCGHGDNTSLEFEKKNNVYLRRLV